jgi:signal transduction histidine kinase/ABC-type uncharacterized transport system substrate-binding protein
MRRHRKLLAQFLTVFFVFVFSSVFSQTPETESVPTSEQNRPFHPNVKTILLLTSYPVADAVTGNFFDSFRKGLREQNMPIDCHVVELNATRKENEDRIESTFARLERSLNAGLYSVVVTLNHEAADVIMRNYDKFPHTLPVLFAGLGRMPANLKELYPNSTGIGIPDDIIGTLDLGLNLFPEAHHLALVADESTISEKTREEILSNCKRQFPQLDYQWIHTFMSKDEIQNKLAALPNESMVIFFPTHDYANRHDENMTAFMQIFEFEQFPCLVMDDTLIGNGVIGGSVIETGQLGREAARMVAQIVNEGGARNLAVKDIKPRKIVDYRQLNNYKGFSGRIPAGTKVVNKPDTFWTRHWRLLLHLAAVSLLVLALLLVFLGWMRRRLRARLSILDSLPGRVMVLNRAETILFSSDFKTRFIKKKNAPKKLEQITWIDYPKISNAIHDVFQSGKQFTIEYNYKDEHRAVSFAPLPHNIFRQDAVICFSLDNTELQNARRRAEENANRAQAADKAKSFFIASVSHEIRTPLNSVIGFAELLREGGVSQEQSQEYLDAISSSANALLMLINDVLDLSKLEANQMKIITAFTDFNALCREVLLIFTFRAQENGNKLVSEVPEDLPELDVDNIRIRQILINLLGNAVKFTKKGTITLHVTFTPDPGSAATGLLQCAVSDTGIGISEEDQKKLMEPFVQLSRVRDTNAVKNGTGLGLSISKRLASCMNGELTCTSKPGEGSTFAVTLKAVRYRAKAVKSQSKSKPEAEAIAHDVKSIRILIVDDVPMNLRVAKALFNKIGFDNVFTAGSGKEALELLDRQPIDLVLSDMWMPEMNGTQLAAEIKKNTKLSHIPVTAQTADVETSGNFDMSHFDAIILKPLTGEKLSNMIKRIIEDGDLRKGADGAPVNLG